MTFLGLLLSNTLNFTYEIYFYFFKLIKELFNSLNLTNAKLQRFFIPYKFSD